jgi:7-carboxy-7-deazaguanine synthase
MSKTTAWLAQDCFISLEGESVRQGLPVIFVRFLGCNLRCQSSKYPECHCDSEYSFTKSDLSEEVTLKDLMKKVHKYPCKRVAITGGEPLLQKDFLDIFLAQLTKEGYEVSIETNGSQDIKWIKDKYPKVIVIGDWKCPVAFGEDTNKKMLESNLALYEKTDALKFVVAKEDFEEVEKVLKNHKDLKAQVYLSPAWGTVEFAEVADWIIKHPEYNTRLSIQIHKIIWDKDNIYV